MFLFKRKKKQEIPLTPEQKNWNLVWELFASGELDNINSDIYALAEYEGGVSCEGHRGFFDNDEKDLPKYYESLKRILPIDLFDNFDRAYQSWKADNDDDICEQCDVYFFEHENIIIDILQEFGNKLNNN